MIFPRTTFIVMMLLKIKVFKGIIKTLLYIVNLKGREGGRLGEGVMSCISI